MVAGDPELPADGHVKEPRGWGASHDATKWEVVNMDNPPELFKVVDGNGTNVADRFQEKANAQQFIQYHRFKQTECEAQSNEDEKRRWDYIQKKCIVSGKIDEFGVEKLFADAQSNWKEGDPINWRLTTEGDPNEDPHLRPDFDDYKGTGNEGKMQYYTASKNSWRTDFKPSRGTQERNWKDKEELEENGCLGSEPGAQAFEMTAYIRVHGINQDDEGISFKVRGGRHSSPNDNASCTEIVYHYDGSENNTAARELRHPDYDKFDVKPKFKGGIKEGKWVGFKCTSWNESYTSGKLKNVVNRLYVDKDPLNEDGTPKNKFELWLEWIDKNEKSKDLGYPFHPDNSTKPDGYNSSAWWAGYMETIRIDETDKVDIGYYSYREIDPTKPLTDRS